MEHKFTSVLLSLMTPRLNLENSELVSNNATFSNIWQSFFDSSIFFINGGFSTVSIVRFSIKVFNRPILSPLASGLEVLLITPIGSGATIIYNVHTICFDNSLLR